MAEKKNKEASVEVKSVSKEINTDKTVKVKEKSIEEPKVEEKVLKVKPREVFIKNGRILKAGEIKE